MLRVNALLFIGLFLSSPSAKAQDRDMTATGLAFDGTFTPARAMKLIYGSYDNSEQQSVWTPKQTDTYPKSWPDDLYVHILLDASYVQSDIPKHLLVTWASPTESGNDEFSCHACGVLIGLTLFSKTKGGWRAEASDLQFAEEGVLGQPPTISLQPVGVDRFGLLMVSPDNHGGEVTEFLSIFVCKGTGFVKAFGNQTADSMDSDTWNDICAKPQGSDNFCVEYEGSIDFVPRSGSAYYDLLLTKHIYHSSYKKMPTGTAVTRFHFDGSKYVAATKNAS